MRKLVEVENLKGTWNRYALGTLWKVCCVVNDRRCAKSDARTEGVIFCAVAVEKELNWRGVKRGREQTCTAAIRL